MHNSHFSEKELEFTSYFDGQWGCDDNISVAQSKSSEKRSSRRSPSRVYPALSLSTMTLPAPWLAYKTQDGKVRLLLVVMLRVCLLVTRCSRVHVHLCVCLARGLVRLSSTGILLQPTDESDDMGPSFIIGCDEDAAKAQQQRRI